MDRELPLRITLIDPPADVCFAVQRGRDEILSARRAGSGPLSLDLAVRVRPDAEGAPRFLGPCAHGPAHARFVYVTVGHRAGDPSAHWDRRAKIPLGGITMAMVDQVSADDSLVLEARIAGRARDGGPCCASVPLLDGGWRASPRD